jgi:hypothetical protein
MSGSFSGPGRGAAAATRWYQLRSRCPRPRSADGRSGRRDDDCEHQLRGVENGKPLRRSQEIPTAPMMMPKPMYIGWSGGLSK